MKLFLCDCFVLCYVDNVFCFHVCVYLNLKKQSSSNLVQDCNTVHIWVPSFEQGVGTTGDVVIVLNGQVSTLMAPFLGHLALFSCSLVLPVSSLL